jgi:hypothetical protein
MIFFDEPWKVEMQNNCCHKLLLAFFAASQHLVRC